MYASADELIRAFRTRMRDTKAPYFWTDSELYQYMSNGESVIAERILCIQDMSSEACVYDVSLGDAEVSLHPSMVRIRDARWVENGSEIKLDIKSVDQVVSQGARILTQNGRPHTLMTGATTDGVRLYPIPQNDGQLVLSIFRTPLKQLSESNKKFEIPFQYRAALLEWMKFEALMKDDAETFDRERAERALSVFDMMVDGYETNEQRRRGGPQSGFITYGGL